MAKSMMVLNVGKTSVNVTWGCNEERGDVDCHFQVFATETTAVAKYSDHTASGDGWSISSKRFDLQSANRPMFNVANVVDNPHGISTDDTASPMGQISTVFDSTLEAAGVSVAELLEIVEEKVPVKDIKYFDEFRKYWTAYA